MQNPKPYFEVDRAGLARLQERRGKSFAVLELLQNALDEDVSEVVLTLEPLPGRPLARLCVADDSREGFHDIRHAYTLFSDSVKRADASKRGRFTLGEKLVLALCERASIHTTTGTVSFDGRGRYEEPRRRRERGSVFEGELRMTRDELAQALACLDLVLVPDEVTVTLNGRELPARCAVRAFSAVLPTELAGEDGVLRRAERRCEVRLVEPRHSERPYLYELGLPVMEIPGRWHLDVGQRIPLGMERDSVSSAYLRRLVTETVAGAYDLLSDEDARADWVGDALGSGKLPGEAVKRIVAGRYGERRVSADPSDPEGTKIAMSRGYTVISGGAFNKDQWRAIRAAGAVKPAGQVTPSPKPYSSDPNAPVRKALPPERMTDGMRAVKALTERLCSRLLPENVHVEVLFIADRAVKASAVFGPPRGRRCVFEYNVSWLGRRFFEQGSAHPGVLALIIHELGHFWSADHLSSAYHDALCELGGQLAALALQEPELFGDFVDEPVAVLA